jgi:hypothetical protein
MRGIELFDSSFPGALAADALGKGGSGGGEKVVAGGLASSCAAEGRAPGSGGNNSDRPSIRLSSGRFSAGTLVSCVDCAFGGRTVGVVLASVARDGSGT